MNAFSILELLSFTYKQKKSVYLKLDRLTPYTHMQNSILIYHFAIVLSIRTSEGKGTLKLMEVEFSGIL